MTEQEILAKLQEIVNQIFGSDDIVIDEKTKLSKDLNISSFALIQLICMVEDEFGISIPNLEIKRIKDVKTLIRFLKKHSKA